MISEGPAVLGPSADGLNCTPFADAACPAFGVKPAIGSPTNRLHRIVVPGVAVVSARTEDQAQDLAHLLPVAGWHLRRLQNLKP